MAHFRVAILGCGTVGGGVARILLEQSELLAARAGKKVELAKIVDLFPRSSSKRHDIPIAYYCADQDELTSDEALAHIEQILHDDTIDLVVETIGGSNPFVCNLVTDVLRHGKHLATANKALLSKYGKEIFAAASAKKRAVGFEAAVCGAIPIIRAIEECFAGDEIFSISGIMNGTSNYILSKMASENQSFGEALAKAQEHGYAEADPSLDINGGDAGHKLTILLKLIFNLDVSLDELPIEGIEAITSDDMAFAEEMDCALKLIGYARRDRENVFATVRPMLVKRSNLLSKIDNATNAVRLMSHYARESVLIGQGAGSLETGSAIVSDIVFIAKYGGKAVRAFPPSVYNFRSFKELAFPYNIVFKTEDVPGITGIVATAIGKQGINIETISHNRHNHEKAVFAIATAPCTHEQIQGAIDDVKKNHPSCLLAEPKVIPILMS